MAKKWSDVVKSVHRRQGVLGVLWMGVVLLIATPLLGLSWAFGKLGDAALCLYKR
jgi:hypothetical protein